MSVNFVTSCLPVDNGHLIRPVDAGSVGHEYRSLGAVQARALDLVIALVVPEQVSATWINSRTATHWFHSVQKQVFIVAACFPTFECLLHLVLLCVFFVLFCLTVCFSQCSLCTCNACVVHAGNEWKLTYVYWLRKTCQVNQQYRTVYKVVWHKSCTTGRLFAFGGSIVTVGTYRVGQKMKQLWFVLLLQPFKIK